MGVNLLFSRKHLAFLHTALSICHPNVNTSCSLLSHGTNADSWELMQRASVFTVFIKALSACHVNTPLTLTFEQKMKVSPGSPRTKIGHPFWTTASSPRRKTAGAAAVLRLRGRDPVNPQPPHLQASRSTSGLFTTTARLAKRLPHKLHWQALPVLNNKSGMWGPSS